MLNDVNVLNYYMFSQMNEEKKKNIYKIRDIAKKSNLENIYKSTNDFINTYLHHHYLNIVLDYANSDSTSSSGCGGTYKLKLTNQQYALFTILIKIHIYICTRFTRSI